MNRNTRTLIVVLIAVGVAAVASYGVLRAIQNMPVREVEDRTQIVAEALEVAERAGHGQPGRRVLGRPAVGGVGIVVCVYRRQAVIHDVGHRHGKEPVIEAELVKHGVGPCRGEKIHVTRGRGVVHAAIGVPARQVSAVQVEMVLLERRRALAGAGAAGRVGRERRRVELREPKDVAQRIIEDFLRADKHIIGNPDPMELGLTGSQVTIGRRRHSTGESPDIDLSDLGETLDPALRLLAEVAGRFADVAGGLGPFEAEHGRITGSTPIRLWSRRALSGLWPW